MNLINGTTLELPVVITRGYVSFPKQQTTLSVQRPFSINAINDSKESFESYCVVVSQVDFDSDYINSYDDIYHFATICKIVECSQAKNDIKTRISIQ